MTAGERRRTIDSHCEPDNASAVFDYFSSPLLRPAPEIVGVLAAVVCVLHFLVLALLARQHTIGGYGTETDFYHLFAPDAERLAAGQFPHNTFQGPGYPFTLMLLGKLPGLDLFTAGKWLSVLCAVAVGWLTFVLFARLFGVWIGLGAQLLVIVSGEFPQFSLQATTDVFFLALCLTALVVFTNENWTIQRRLVWTAVLTSCAYLTRYNGLFLLVTFLVGILLLDFFDLIMRQRLEAAAIFLIVFLFVAAPWFHFNYKNHGSPLYNTNYLNIATEYYGELAGGEVNQDATRALEQRFHSFGDVLFYDPQRLLTQYPVKLLASLRNIVATTLLNRVVAWLALLGLALALLLQRSQPVLLVLLAGLLYLLLMALNHWETRYYFFVLVLAAGLAVYAVARLFALAQAQHWFRHPALTLLPVAFGALLWLLSLLEAGAGVKDFLANQPTEVPAACAYLKSTGAHHPLRIVARKPHLAYVCRAEWVFFPPVKSLAELQAWIAGNKIDYLALGHRELKERKELRPLADPQQAPPWLKAAWLSVKPPLILYQPVAVAQQ